MLLTTLTSFFQWPMTSDFPSLPESALQGIVRTNLDSPHPTVDQLARKARSLAAVKALALPFIDHLPVVEDASHVQPRTVREVAERCLASVFCALKGESNDQTLVEEVVDAFGASTYFSPIEQAFIQDLEPSRQSLVNFAWGYEHVHVFLWALGFLSELQGPAKIANVPHEAGLIQEEGAEGLFEHGCLRSMDELLDAADFYYRLHWAAIELRIKGQPSEAADEGIIMERHRALNWLIRYMDQAWDDVTTDT